MLTGNDFDPADEEKSETQPLLSPPVVDPVPQVVITIDKPKFSYKKFLNLPQDVWFSILQFVDVESFSLYTLSAPFEATLRISIPNQKKFHELKHLGFLSNLNSVFDHLQPMMKAAEEKATVAEKSRSVSKAKLGVLLGLAVCGVVAWQGDYRFFRFLLGERSTYKTADDTVRSTFKTLNDRCDVTRYNGGDFFGNENCKDDYSRPTSNKPYTIECWCTSNDLLSKCDYGDYFCQNVINAMQSCDAVLYAIYTAACDTKEENDHYGRNIFLATLIIFFTLAVYSCTMGFFGDKMTWFKRPKADELTPILPLLTDERLSAVDRNILHHYELTDKKNTIKFGEIRLRVDNVKALVQALYEHLIIQLKKDPTVLELECKVMFLQVLERVIALAMIETTDRKALSRENKIILLDAKTENYLQQKLTSAQNTLVLLQDEKNTLDEKQIEATSELLSLVAPDYNLRVKRSEVDSCSMTLFRHRQTLFAVKAQHAVIDKLQPKSNVLPVGLFAGKRSQPRLVNKDQVEQKQVNVGAAPPAVLN